jgi:hypothetical protein
MAASVAPLRMKSRMESARRGGLAMCQLVAMSPTLLYQVTNSDLVAICWIFGLQARLGEGSGGGSALAFGMGGGGLLALARRGGHGGLARQRLQARAD